MWLIEQAVEDIETFCTWVLFVGVNNALVTIIGFLSGELAERRNK